MFQTLTINERGPEGARHRYGKSRITCVLGDAFVDGRFGPCAIKRAKPKRL